MGLFDSIKEITDTVKAAKNGIEELKTGGKDLVSGYAKGASEALDNIQKNTDLGLGGENKIGQKIDHVQKKLDGLSRGNGSTGKTDK